MINLYSISLYRENQKIRSSERVKERARWGEE